MFLIILLIVIVVFMITVSADYPNNYYLSDSKIHGKGVFAAKDYIKDELIDVGIRGLFITNGFGTMINHSYNPNTYLHRNGINYNVHALTNIKKDDELTLNYNNTPWFIDGPRSDFK